MKRFIRAEDFSVDETRIVLGGRILEGRSIISLHSERRVSAELLGLYCIIIVFTFTVALHSREPILFVVILAILCLGTYREIRRAWVLVMNIHQLGGFEVRGFTQTEAAVAVELVDRLRG